MKPEAISLIGMRKPKEDDEKFIYSTWLAGMYFGNIGLKTRASKEEFTNNYRQVIRKIIGFSTIQIAALLEDPDIICGYSVSEPNRKVVHWVYCKPAFRRLGLATDLVPKETEFVTHITEMVRNFLPDQITFDPYRI
jgi:hypothetical protein